LAVDKGEIIAIIGRSGSGKSTLLRCVNGLEPIQGGSVAFDGTTVNDPSTDLRKLRQHVGIVFQSFNLFPHLSVEKNITLAPKVVKGVPSAEARRLAEEVLAKVGLAEKIDAYPDQLSGGQQQRVAISACQMDKPETAAGPNYQAPAATLVPPANLRSVCFVDPDLMAFRTRMVQQELVVGVLSCTGADGSRKLDKQYTAFIQKFTPE